MYAPDWSWRFFHRAAMYCTGVALWLRARSRPGVPVVINVSKADARVLTDVSNARVPQPWDRWHLVVACEHEWYGGECEKCGAGIPNWKGPIMGGDLDKHSP